jgi:hypothetical protein
MDNIGNAGIAGILNKIYNNTLNTLTQSDIKDTLAFLGMVWTSKNVLTVPAGESNLFIDPTGAIGQEKVIVMLPPCYVGVGGDHITLTTYLGATYAGGASQIITNRNQKVTTNSLTNIVYGGTLVTPGQQGNTTLIPSSGTGPFQSTGEGEEKLIIPIDENVVTRIKIINQDTSSSTLNYNFIWAEI